jgi:pilus assembly protein CpaB
MNWKTWTPLAVAVVLGVVAAKMTRDVIVRSRAAAPAASKLVSVVVAKDDLPPGTELAAAHLSVRQLPADGAPERAFAGIDELVGRVTEMQVVKGQTVLAPMLAEAGSGSGLQALVPVGMRAITVEVNEFSGVAGLLTPGCRVDVVATLQPSGGGMSVARTVVENVRVTAVGRRLGGTSDGDSSGESTGETSKSVTLLVTPAQAEAIELTAASSRPRLVLRGGRDDRPSDTAGVSLAALIGTADAAETQATAVDAFAAMPPTPATRPAVAAMPSPAPSRRTVQVIRAGVESSVEVAVPAPQRPGPRFPYTAQDEHELMTRMPVEDE